MKTFITRLIGFYLNLLAVIAPRTAGKMGFNLFCTPKGVPLKDHQRDFLNGADKFSFTSRGTTLQGYRWGNGEKKLLFVHGWQSHSFRWKNYIESFPKDEFTIYAFDAPAHGLSGGRYLNLPLYSKALESFLNTVYPIHTIIGHSLGSFATIYSFARLNTLPVRQLIITGTPGEAEEFFQHYQRVLGLSKRAMKAVYVAFYEKLGVLPSFFSAATFAKTVNVPTLIIHDENDPEAPYRHALDIHDAIDGSTLVTTSGFGHNLRSASVVKHVFDFVRRSEPAIVEVDQEVTY